MQAAVFGEDFQQRARQLEAALGRLVGIGRRADHDREAVDSCGVEVTPEQCGGVLLDQDPSLEGLRRGEHGGLARGRQWWTLVRSAVDGPAVRLAGVAVGTAELTADIGVQ